ncbi:hypothetical protein ACPC5U_12920 [Acinetobacter haemolyticus]|uniref:hypothetical protein n=1 Tax=Acinetobacter haemolyticus TaxID=29430 RepID=UPI003C187A65
MGSIVDQYEIFEWFKQDLTVKSPAFNAANVRTTSNVGKIDYQDRLGVIGAMECQLSKSVATLILWDGQSESDYDYVRNYLAKIMLETAQKHKRREPQNIAIYWLSWLVARKVIDFALDPSLEKRNTALGELYYIGMNTLIMDLEIYRKSWKPYEKQLNNLLQDEIAKVALFMDQYRKQTLDEAQN